VFLLLTSRGGEGIRCLVTAFAGKKPTCCIIYIFNVRTLEKQDFPPEPAEKKTTRLPLLYEDRSPCIILYEFAIGQFRVFSFFFSNLKPLHPLSITPRGQPLVNLWRPCSITGHRCGAYAHTAYRYMRVQGIRERVPFDVDKTSKCSKCLTMLNRTNNVNLFFFINYWPR